MVHIKKKILKRKQWQSFLISFEEHCCYSITKQCLALCNPMDCSTPGFPVLHYYLEFSQTHVHWVTDVIRLSHPLSPSSPPALSLSQPASGSFPVSWLFTSGGQSIGASASAPVRNFDQDPTCNSHQPFLNLPWTPVHSDFASAPDSLSLMSPLPHSQISFKLPGHLYFPSLYPQTHQYAAWLSLFGCNLSPFLSSLLRFFPFFLPDVNIYL